MEFAPLIFGNATPAESSTPFLLAVVVATTMVVVATRRRVQRSQRENTGRSSGKLNPHNAMVQKRAESIRAQNSAESEASAAMLELQDYARQIQAQVDNRFQKLEAASRRADRKIAELRQLLEQTHVEANPLSKPCDPDDRPKVSDPMASA